MYRAGGPDPADIPESHILGRLNHAPERRSPPTVRRNPGRVGDRKPLLIRELPELGHGKGKLGDQFLVLHVREESFCRGKIAAGAATVIPVIGAVKKTAHVIDRVLREEWPGSSTPFQF